MKPLLNNFQRIDSMLRCAKAHLGKLKQKIKESKKSRKKSGNGIESQLFSILKTIYGVKIQAYHGGSLTGKTFKR